MIVLFISEPPMGTVGINPPKTPVTKGSNGVAAATVPNVCKMPGPPAPFVPTPLPNIGKSGDSPKGYSKKVKIDGHTVAIRGATFKSTGDMASKGTGGGLVSANTHGPTKFVGLGSLDTKIEGKNVQLLSDPMLNNCGPSGSPPNSATLAGVLQEAKAKNPANEDVCGPGNHSESIQYPEVPKSEWHPKKRVDAMRRVARSQEDLFEIRAAEHNIADGSITHGSQLSRNLTPEEKAAGVDPDDQKVWAVCKACGYRREIDQAPDKNNTVEAKSSSNALKSSDQKTNNLARVAQGKGVTYKAPPIGAQQLQSLTDSGFKFIAIT
ncbi:PAAR-like domain-containing protein [Paraliomyxa miuraensis]|uniref:PAAR-like domain-containing protein n=1 Tax=Paraliomyxa miuraensis TaxID=376150 RepID=UPI002254C96B|nr:PAAR-like domain-containing protein [Paraliomyxa miuraensis]MCX4240157.1 DUF4150 domain-containing protein [Paraliomyxa miuraensis]